MIKANIGRIEIQHDSLTHGSYPSFSISLPIDSDKAYKRGTILQFDDKAEKLVATPERVAEGRKEQKVFVLSEDVKDSTTALVIVLGVVQAQQCMIHGSRDKIPSARFRSFMKSSNLIFV